MPHPICVFQQFRSTGVKIAAPHHIDLDRIGSQSIDQMTELTFLITVLDQQHFAFTANSSKRRRHIILFDQIRATLVGDELRFGGKNA